MEAAHARSYCHHLLLLIWAAIPVLALATRMNEGLREGDAPHQPSRHLSWQGIQDPPIDYLFRAVTLLHVELLVPGIQHLAMVLYLLHRMFGAVSN